MQSKLFLGLFASILLLSQFAPIAFSQSPLATLPITSDSDIANQLDAKLATLQIPFIQNNGQADPQVKFYASMFSGTVFVTDDEIAYMIQKNDTALVVKEQFLSKYDLSPTGLEQSQASVSYFKGEQENWKSNIPTFNSISLGQIWDSINVNLVAHGNNVEKLFFVNPGGNVNDIGMKVDGANSLQTSETGELIINTDSGDISMTAPVAFQVIDGVRKDIPVSYVVNDIIYGFVVGDYDHSVLLTIDPLLASTFIGGSNYDYASAIAIDSTGRVYVAGYTTSTTDYPTTSGAYDESHNGGGDVFVSRFDADLSTLERSTFIGGSGADGAYAITIDSTGRVYVAGYAESTYPSTSGAYDESHNGGGDVFVSRFDADLSTLEKSTFIGGSSVDYAKAIAIDSTGRVYVAGYTQSTAYPATSGAYDGTFNGGVDVFVSRLDADLSTLEKSTFIGGSGDDSAYALALDSTGRVYVAGYTNDAPTDYPVTTGAYDESHDVSEDVFISRFDADLSTLEKSTFIGGSSEDSAYALALDSTGRVYVTGFTISTNYPTMGAYDGTFNGGYDVFISRFDADLSTLERSTFIGGSGGNLASAIAIDSTGRVYVAGSTYDDITDYPVISGAYDESHNGVTDVFISRFDADLSTLEKSTFIGGSSEDSANAIALDSTGRVYVTGFTTSTTDYPTTSGAYDESHNGSGDVFVSKISSSLSLTDAPSPVTTISINDVALNEGNKKGNSPFSFTITRSGDTSGASSVNFATSDGTATGGGASPKSNSDYTSKSGTVNFAAGENIKTVTIVVKGDTKKEANETFNVNLSSQIGCTISDNLGIGTIQNDD